MAGVGVDRRLVVTGDFPDGADNGHSSDAGMWHVTVTVAGEAVDPRVIRSGLERLAQERPFLLSARYAADHAEVSYWEEARDVDDAAALALRLWGEHRASAELPAWTVAGVEVVDRATFQRRSTETPAPALVPAGGVRPF